MTDTVRRHLIGLLAAVLAVAGLAVTTSTPPAQAADVPSCPSASTSYVPKPGNLFNVVRGVGGSEAEQYRLSRMVENTLASMAAGAVARIAVYRLNVPCTAQAIIAAHKRGVIVRVIFEGLGTTPEESAVMQALGQNINSARGYAITCSQSCNSDQTSAMHIKGYWFSSTGRSGVKTATHVSVVGSSNLTTTNQYLNWNQTQVLTDPSIYVASIRFFDQMRYDRDNERVFSTALSKDGRYRIYLWPAGTIAQDPWLTALKSISNAECRGTASGYGVGGRTEILVNMFYWTGGRTSFAYELRRLHKAGCVVKVLFTNNPGVNAMAQSVIDILWYGGVPIYDSRVLTAVGGSNHYTHGKGFMVNGRLFSSRGNKVVWNGSTNLTANALINGNELSLRTDHNATYDAFKANFNLMVKHSIRQTRRPITTLPVSKQQAPDDGRRTIPTDPEFDDLGRL